MRKDKVPKRKFEDKDVVKYGNGKSSEKRLVEKSLQQGDGASKPACNCVKRHHLRVGPSCTKGMLLPLFINEEFLFEVEFSQICAPVKIVVPVFRPPMKHCKVFFGSEVPPEDIPFAEFELQSKVVDNIQCFFYAADNPQFSVGIFANGTTVLIYRGFTKLGEKLSRFNASH